MPLLKGITMSIVTRVRLENAEEVDRLDPVIGFAGDDETRRREDVAERVAHEERVVDDEHAFPRH